MTTLEIRQQINQKLDHLSVENLQLVAEFLAYLSEKESEEATQELLDIPGFIEAFERGEKDIAENRVASIKTSIYILKYPFFSN